MQAISEKWEITIGRKTYIISGDEMRAILGAGDARFVKFRDLIINPAFVQDMKLIESNVPKLKAPPIQVLNNRGEWEDIER